jgi:formylglycine-generating enzyme required for sulfatase activity
MAIAFVNEVGWAAAAHMIVLPPGSYEMGATAMDRFATLLERPRRRVTMTRAVALAATPVTFLQWDAYASSEPDAHRPDDGGFGRGPLPVTGVSWLDAVEYCRWLSGRTGGRYRLPTEAEWEYACRAGGSGIFGARDDLTVGECNYMYDELGKEIGAGRPLPVASYPANAFGLYDMCGSVGELTFDHWHDGYQGAPLDGSAWTDLPDARNPLRVLRGGSWDYPPRLLRCAYRDWIHESKRLDNVGFRLALELDV